MLIGAHSIIHSIAPKQTARSSARCFGCRTGGFVRLAHFAPVRVLSSQRADPGGHNSYRADRPDPSRHDKFLTSVEPDTRRRKSGGRHLP
jgi:hypothetical protein